MPPTTSDKASPTEIREFFANETDQPNTDGVRLVPPREIMAFKKSDPDGYDDVARGIKNGTLTY